MSPNLRSRRKSQAVGINSNAVRQEKATSTLNPDFDKVPKVRLEKMRLTTNNTDSCKNPSPQKMKLRSSIKGNHSTENKENQNRKSKGNSRKQILNSESESDTSDNSAQSNSDECSIAKQLEDTVCITSGSENDNCHAGRVTRSQKANKHQKTNKETIYKNKRNLTDTALNCTKNSPEDSDESYNNSTEIDEESSDEQFSSENSTDSESDNEELKCKKSESTKVYLNSNDITTTEIGNKKMTLNYHPNTELYFLRQSEKSKSSKNAFSKLNDLNVGKKQLDELKSEKFISREHKLCMDKLIKKAQQQFAKWMYLMEEGFSILLYGLGSKRVLINKFHELIAANHPSVIVNGFFPSLTVKDILDNMITDLMGMEAPSNQNDCLELIQSTMRENPNDKIFLFIHSIDGPMLRAQKTQGVLSRLALVPNIYLIASVDHQNTSLLWDNTMRTRYNFYWEDTPTFKPYDAETSYESSFLVQKSGVLALQSLQSVFLSLTPNAKNIFIILAKYQVEHYGKNYMGMAFRELFQRARESFLVSSDVTLRAQLTEFLDHELAKTKRGIDGTELLSIPLDNSLLKQFIQEQESMS